MQSTGNRFASINAGVQQRNHQSNLLSSGTKPTSLSQLNTSGIQVRQGIGQNSQMVNNGLLIATGTHDRPPKRPFLTQHSTFGTQGELENPGYIHQSGGSPMHRPGASLLDQSTFSSNNKQSGGRLHEHRNSSQGLPSQIPNQASNFFRQSASAQANNHNLHQLKNQNSGLVSQNQSSFYSNMQQQ